MSISFDGVFLSDRLNTNATSVRLTDADGEERYFNLSNANAYAFLAFLGLPEESSGSVDMPTVRRAIIRARATFERKVDGFTRETVTSGGDGRCTMVDQGIDRDYFATRLDQFSAHVEALATAGANTISWG